MTIFGPQGIRDSIRKSYQKHVSMFETGTDLPEGISVHHAALHSTLVLRYAFAFKPVPEALVWLEIGPLLSLPDEDALEALAEYVVFKEMPARANGQLLSAALARGMNRYSSQDQDFFRTAAENYHFPWLKLWLPKIPEPQNPSD